MNNKRSIEEDEVEEACGTHNECLYESDWRSICNNELKFREKSNNDSVVYTRQFEFDIKNMNMCENSNETNIYENSIDMLIKNTIGNNIIHKDLIKFLKSKNLLKPFYKLFYKYIYAIVFKYKQYSFLIKKQVTLVNLNTRSFHVENGTEKDVVVETENKELLIFSL